MKKQLLIAVCGLFLAVGAANAGAQIHITIGPPPRPHEVMPARPPEHRDWVWQPGYHRWEGGHYVWVAGGYVAPPRPRARWVAGRWDHRGGEYVWVEGRWR